MPTPHQINDFNIGMNPNIYGEGITRIEHFDTTNGQARPFYKLVASTMGNLTDKLTNFARGKNSAGSVNILWGLGQIFNDPAYNACLMYWGSGQWNTLKNFSVASSAFAQVLHYYGGSVYGLYNGTHIWKSTPGADSGSTSFSATHAALTYTNYCRPITRSVDNLMYFGIDNKIVKFDGTTATTVFTHPITTFVFTSISENGVYLQLCGYDTGTYEAESFLWDGNSAVVDVTQKYSLYKEYPQHTFNLGGTQFAITTKISTTNPVASSRVNVFLNIKYISGDKFKIHKQFAFTSISLSRGLFIDNEIAYFPAIVKFKGDSAQHFVVFRLTSTGELSIAQNVAIADSLDVNVVPTDVIIDDTSFWIAGSTNGQWNSSSSYPSVTAQSSFIETVKYRVKDLSQNLDFVRATITWETMPADGQVLLKTRGDAETSWTTIATFTTDSSVKGTITKQGCTTQPSIAKERQYRIESLGGTIITGFQVDHEEVNNQA